MTLKVKVKREGRRIVKLNVAWECCEDSGLYLLPDNILNTC
jgi:hypothetical protein